MNLLNRVRDWLTRRGRAGEAQRMQDPIYALLRAEVTRLGKQFEALPFERLLEPDESWSMTKVVEGITLSFEAELFKIKDNGDIGVCIDARAEPNRTGRQPSYQFYKRKDGSVYY
ncbi:MAG: hypothetical protein ACYC6N_03500 [Pirellulaceae bacterium]